MNQQACLLLPQQRLDLRLSLSFTFHLENVESIEVQTHTPRLTWSLRIHHLEKENHLNQTTIFRFYINLWGCNMTSTRFRFCSTTFSEKSPLTELQTWSAPYYLRWLVSGNGDKSATLIQGWTKNSQNLGWMEDFNPAFMTMNSAIKPKSAG